MEIRLNGGERLLVDDQDINRISGHVWYAVYRYYKGKKLGVERVIAKGSNGRLLLHRFLMDAPPDKVVDHINGNPLDNRLSNLRLATHAENTRNRARASHNKCGFKGVYEKRPGDWVAYVTHEGKKYRKSGFKTKELAYEARKIMAKNLHGEFYCP